MEPQNLLKLLHVLSVGLFAGPLFALLMVQTRLQRATDAAGRETLASAVGFGARAVVNPLAYAGFLSGLLYWVFRFGQFGGSRLMACTPVYVYIMLLCGLLAVGFAQMWKARARKLHQALASGASTEVIHAHLARGWVFALLALLSISSAYCVAVLRVPNHISAACFSDMGRD